MAELLLIADASTLLNFLKVGRFDLIEAYGHRVLIVDAVYEEVKSHREELQALVQTGVLELYKTEDTGVLEAASALVGRGLGSGESFSIAAAIETGAKVALDDRQAIKLAQREHRTLECVTTVDLVTAAILQGSLTVADADDLKADWAANHRFSIKFASFSERVGVR